jgi:hypothetical protein
LVEAMTRLRVALGLLFGMASVLAAVTLVALEGREVALLRTVDEHGNARSTRVWVADEDGYVWIEAANRNRPFLRDVRAIAEVELRRGGTLRRCQAVAVPNPEGHERMRHLLAAKYGWADRWIGRLTDTSQSVAVRLQCR